MHRLLRIYAYFALQPFRCMSVFLFAIGTLKLVLVWSVLLEITWRIGLEDARSLLTAGSVFTLLGGLPYFLGGAYFLWKYWDKPGYYWPNQPEDERRILANMSPDQRLQLAKSILLPDFVFVAGAVFFLVLFLQDDFQWIAFAGLLAAAVSALWRRDIRSRVLCATPYAIEHGITPEQLRRSLWWNKNVAQKET